MKQTIKTLALSCLLLFLPLSLHASEKAQEVEWEQLMPADFTLDDIFQQTDLDSLDDYDPKAQLILDNMMAQLASAPVVPEMDGKLIRIPGFVVPVEGDEQAVTEFFLVPYFGACIHVPPPPSNQIIYVRYEAGTRLKNLFDAVWITGRLKTELVSHELASSGYSMEAFRIEPYEL